MAPAGTPLIASTMGTQSLPLELLANWRNRLADLRQSLAATPEHESAWLWAIKYEILAYLLHRYAGDVVPVLVLPRYAPPEPVVVRGPAVDPPPRQVSVPAGMGKAPRAGDAIRGRLAAISSQNRDRYAEQEREAAVQKPDGSQALASRIHSLIALLRRVDKLKLPAPLPDAPAQKMTRESLETGRLLARTQLKEIIRQELAKLGVLPEKDLQTLFNTLTQAVDDETPTPVETIPPEPKA